MKVALIILSLFLFFNNSVLSQTRKDSLIVFVGERIEVRDITPAQDRVDTVVEGTDTVYRHYHIMDNEFAATYSVINTIYGSYTKDTIDFIAFDHYGVPNFSKYKTILLFVSIAEDGKLYHEKYLFDDVYKTTNERWASPVRPFSKEDEGQVKNRKFHKLKFHDAVSYDVSSYDTASIHKLFPKAYFEISGQKAYPTMGVYIEDLFTEKKEGVLKARGIF